MKKLIIPAAVAAAVGSIATVITIILKKVQANTHNTGGVKNGKVKDCTGK